MQKFSWALLTSATALAAGLGLAACSPSDRQEISKTADQAGKTAEHVAKDVAQTAERKVDNGSVTAKVKGVLLADSQVKGTEITVETNDGAVTLSGRVSDPSNKQRAEQLAMNVDGVKSVKNNITVP